MLPTISAASQSEVHSSRLGIWACRGSLAFVSGFSAFLALNKSVKCVRLCAMASSTVVSFVPSGRENDPSGL